jgi:hypothetical protein
MNPDNRTERSRAIERALRAGKSIADAARAVDPPALHQEVYRVRRDHCTDMEFARAPRPTGDNYKLIVTMMKEAATRGMTPVFADLARVCSPALTRARVVQIVENARRRGDLPPAPVPAPPPAPEPPP